MKLVLVVSQGVNAGKSITVNGTEFIIGRDAHCHLRPASPAVSKEHCRITIRDEKVLIRDSGSTNGTFVNGEQIAGEKELKVGDGLKVGPLEFTVKIEAGATAPAAVTAESAATKTTADAAAKSAKPAAAAKPATTAATSAKKETAAPTPTTVAATAVADSPPADGNESSDDLAAMMLMDDEPGGATPTVGSFNPDATTVMEMPALGSPGAAAPPAGSGEKKEEKKGHADSASAAADALSKYFRRPRT